MGGADGVMSLGACKARARRALLALCGDDALGQELIRLWRLAVTFPFYSFLSIPSYHDHGYFPLLFLLIMIPYRIRQDAGAGG